jgi:hypothetical protein
MSAGIDWTPLDRELARWHAAGRRIPLWWRDDDAIADTPPLDRLIAMAERAGLPLHLAVIPAHAETGLARRLAKAPGVVPIVHGWTHLSHSQPPDKKAEFGPARPLAQRLDDAARGLARMQDMFADRLAPIFVPPWNRIAPDMADALPGLGYRALSTYGPRPADGAAPGLDAINTHIDVIDWRGTRSVVPPARLIGDLVDTLRARREGRTDASEPLGLLTHHLVHDPAIWDMTESLLARLIRGPVIPWPGLNALKGPPA